MVLFPARHTRFHPPGIMVPFFTRCLETAVRETRVVTLPRDDQGIPRGSYVFHEFYCEDLTCDCRRVMIVITRAEDEELRERLPRLSGPRLQRPDSRLPQALPWRPRPPWRCR